MSGKASERLKGFFKDVKAHLFCFGFEAETRQIRKEHPSAYLAQALNYTAIGTFFVLTGTPLATTAAMLSSAYALMCFYDCIHSFRDRKKQLKASNTPVP